MDATNAKELSRLSVIWTWDADWMKCRLCRRALVSGRDGEPLKHKDGCKHSEHQHPWRDLRNAIHNQL